MPSSLPLKSQNKDGIKRLIKFALPITFTGLILPLSQFIDSFLIVNIIGSYRGDATALFGLLTGTAMTVINLPVAVCYGIHVCNSFCIKGKRSKQKKERKRLNGVDVNSVANFSGGGVFVCPVNRKNTFR